MVLRRRTTLLLAACLLSVSVWDLSRPPASQWSASAAVSLIHFYQAHLSPIVARAGVRCRFTPTCSRYAEVVIARHGLVAGGWRAARRIARCGPWTPVGTVDRPD